MGGCALLQRMQKSAQAQWKKNVSPFPNISCATSLKQQKIHIESLHVGNVQNIFSWIFTKQQFKRTRPLVKLSFWRESRSSWAVPLVRWSYTIYTYILPPKFKILQVFLEFRGLTFLKPLLVESILCIFHFQAANWSFSPRQRELKQPENHRKEWESPSKLNSARQWDPNLVLFRTIHKICGNWIILAKLFIIQNHHTNQHPTLARSFQSSIIQPICQDDPVVTDWFFDLHGLFTLGSAFYWYQLEF